MSAPRLQLNMRLTEDDRAKLDRLKPRVAAELGIVASDAVVIRLGLTALERQYKRPPKKNPPLTSPPVTSVG